MHYVNEFMTCVGWIITTSTVLTGIAAWRVTRKRREY